MNAGQKVNIAHHIGLMIIQANKAGALHWGSTIYQQAVQQSVEMLPYEERHPDNGVGLGFNDPWEETSKCGMLLEAMLPEGANQSVQLPRGLGYYPVPPWDMGVVRCLGHGVLPL